MDRRDRRILNIPTQLNTLDEVALRIMCAAIACPEPDMSVLRFRNPSHAYERAHEFLRVSKEEDDIRAQK